MMKKMAFVIGFVLVLISITSCQDDQTDSTRQADQSTQTDTPAQTDKPLQKDKPAQKGFNGEYGILPNGDLEIRVEDQTTVMEINALPDSQIIQDDRQRLVILTDPTDRYRHSILGDDLEPTSVTLIQLSEDSEVASTFSVPDDWVIESILPIWSDWDGDGEREIVLTLSNSTFGAKLVLYDEEGNFLAESDPIGKGFRWRHALDIAEFGESGQRLLVEVQTPHIGGIVAFYSWDKDNQILKSEATLSGYSTHDIGSRDMHMYALMTDQRTNQVTLLIPTQSKKQVAALRLAAGEIQEIWREELGGRLSGNIELTEENGQKVLAAVVDDGLEILVELPDFAE